jgi:hypothetical protein
VWVIHVRFPDAQRPFHFEVVKRLSSINGHKAAHVRRDVDGVAVLYIYVRQSMVERVLEMLEIDFNCSQETEDFDICASCSSRHAIASLTALNFSSFFSFFFCAPAESSQEHDLEFYRRGRMEIVRNNPAQPDSPELIVNGDEYEVDPDLVSVHSMTSMGTCSFLWCLFVFRFFHLLHVPVSFVRRHYEPGAAADPAHAPHNDELYTFIQIIYTWGLGLFFFFNITSV